jgi:hypothetical protein
VATVVVVNLASPACAWGTTVMNGNNSSTGDLAEEHHDKVDAGIDAAAQAAGEKFGHEEQIESVADKIKDILPGG